MDILIDQYLTILETITPLPNTVIFPGDIRDAREYKRLKFYVKTDKASTLRIFYSNNPTFANQTVETIAIPPGVGTFESATVREQISKYIKAEIQNTSGVDQTYLEAIIFLQR